MWLSLLLFLLLRLLFVLILVVEEDRGEKGGRGCVDRLTQFDHDARAALAFRVLRRPITVSIHVKRHQLGSMRDAVCAQSTAPHVVLEPVPHAHEVPDKVLTARLVCPSPDIPTHQQDCATKISVHR